MRRYRDYDLASFILGLFFGYMSPLIVAWLGILMHLPLEVTLVLVGGLVVLPLAIPALIEWLVDRRAPRQRDQDAHEPGGGREFWVGLGAGLVINLAQTFIFSSGGA